MPARYCFQLAELLMAPVQWSGRVLCSMSIDQLICCFTRQIILVSYNPLYSAAT